MMLKTVIYTGVLFLICNKVLARADPLYSPYSSKDLANLKTLLERFEDTLGQDEGNDNQQDYDVANPEAEGPQAGSPWDRERERQWPASDYKKPQEGYQSQSSRLRDLLMAPRNNRGSSGCFGSRIDRIGSMSSMGCGGSRKGKPSEYPEIESSGISNIRM
ncbi:natriuretic peptides A [Huso huso]|uniref:Natriuretic peptides A n=2 Tax=Huso huso TaxID=61971 RepID=A0ABR0YYF0_HUSHU